VSAACTGTQVVFKCCQLVVVVVVVVLVVAVAVVVVVGQALLPAVKTCQHGHVCSPLKQMKTVNSGLGLSLDTAMHATCRLGTSSHLRGRSGHGDLSIGSGSR
jgi:hypothetical protein